LRRALPEETNRVAVAARQVAKLRFLKCGERNGDCMMRKAAPTSDASQNAPSILRQGYDTCAVRGHGIRRRASR
jgi:hypothetical protein